MRGHSSARGRSHHWRFTALVVAAALTFSGCAFTIQATGAAGKKSAAILRERDKTCNSPIDQTKQTVETDNKVIGPADTKVTTEPAAPPVVAESRGGELPKQAWWLTAFCFISPTC